MEMVGTTAADYKWAVFHQPNVKFPQRAAQLLGFSSEQIEPGLLSNLVGNVYAGSSLLGLTATLDVAEPGDRILLVSYGSGAGSDAFDLLWGIALPSGAAKRRSPVIMWRGGRKLTTRCTRVIAGSCWWSNLGS